MQSAVQSVQLPSAGGEAGGVTSRNPARNPGKLSAGCKGWRCVTTVMRVARHLPAGKQGITPGTAATSKYSQALWSPAFLYQHFSPNFEG